MLRPETLDLFINITIGATVMALLISLALWLGQIFIEPLTR